MIINDLDGYYIVFDTKNWNTELDTLTYEYIYKLNTGKNETIKISTAIKIHHLGWQ